MSKITIADIAKQAMVSKTTVSRYINGHFGSMSEETRRDIERIITQSNYYPNSAARSLKNRRSMLVGVLISVTDNNRIITQLIWGICKRLKKYGYYPILYDNVAGEESQYLQASLSQNLEGLIVSPTTEDYSVYYQAMQKGLPIVLVDRFQPGWRYDAVYIDHYSVTTDAMRHLAEQGFTRVAFFGDDFSPVSTKAMRKRAYLDCMRGLFGEDGDKYVYQLPLRKDSVMKALQDFMGKYPGEPKAVFAVDSDILMNALDSAQDLGLTMPGDVGICGYDHWGWAKLVDPGVTSVTFPLYEMGLKVVDQLMKRIDKNGKAPEKPVQIKLKGSLNIRRSTLLKEVRVGVE